MNFGPLNETAQNTPYVLYNIMGNNKLKLKLNSKDNSALTLTS